MSLNAAYAGTISGNTATGPGFNGISVTAGATVSGNESWAQLGMPYVVNNSGVTINAGASLTIQPGVVVKFNKFTNCCPSTAYLRVLGSGTLTANGTPAQPIYFTSYLDDAIAGDTNGDGTASRPAAGDWSGIRFESGSSGSLSNVVIRYGGGNNCCGPQYAGLDIATGSATQPVLGSGIQITDEVTGIAVSGTGTNIPISGIDFERNTTSLFINGGSPTISGNTINGGTTGINVSSGTSIITGNTITGTTTGIAANGGGGSIANNTITTAAGQIAMSLNAAYAGTISGNTATGPGFNGISVTAGATVSGNESWAQLGMPYVVNNSGVTINAGASLTIQPGVVVKFNKFTNCCPSTAYLRVLGSGTLPANGTPAQPIYFTSYLDDAIAGDTNGDGTASRPAAGDWSGIRFESGSSGSLSNVVIRYGGGNNCCGPQYAGLDIATGSATHPVLGSGIQITDEVTGLALSGTGTSLTISGAIFTRNGS